MAKQHIRPRALHQSLDHLVALNPRVVVAREPPLRHGALVILLDVVHVGRKHPRAAVGQIELQDAESRRVAWCKVDVETGRNLEELALKGLPVEVEAEVVRLVGTCLSRHGRMSVK